VDVEVGRSGVILLLLLLLLLGIVEPAEGILALARVAEGISEVGAGGIDRVWVKGVGDVMRGEMGELLLLGLLLGLLLLLLGGGGLCGGGVEMEALLTDFCIRGVVEKGHLEG
jgi:hypothetical protein